MRVYGFLFFITFSLIGIPGAPVRNIFEYDSDLEYTPHVVVAHAVIHHDTGQTKQFTMTRAHDGSMVHIIKKKPFNFKNKLKG